MKKKVISIILSVVVVLTFLAACSGTSNTPNDNGRTPSEDAPRETAIPTPTETNSPAPNQSDEYIELWNGYVLKDVDGNEYIMTIEFEENRFTLTQYRISIKWEYNEAPSGSNELFQDIPPPVESPGRKPIFSDEFAHIINTVFSTSFDSEEKFSNGIPHGVAEYNILQEIIHGTYSADGSKIEFVLQDNVVKVMDFSMTENTMRIDRHDFTRSGFTR